MSQPQDKQAELTEHLAELRTRIIRSLVYVAVGTAVCWFMYDRIFTLLTNPLTQALSDTKFQMTGLAEGFVLRMQMCVISGLIVAIPLVTIEMWGFVSPALSREEKRPLMWIAPMSVILFAAGVTLCYYTIPTAIKWLVQYTPPNAEFRPFISQNLLFVVKMLFAFGLAFELPVVLMLLARLGILSSGTLKSYWRHAVLILAIFAAVITPSGDAFTMMMMTVPLCVLYLLSIILVRFVEPKNDI